MKSAILLITIAAAMGACQKEKQKNSAAKGPKTTLSIGVQNTGLRLTGDVSEITSRVRCSDGQNTSDYNIDSATNSIDLYGSLDGCHIEVTSFKVEKAPSSFITYQGTSGLDSNAAEFIEPDATQPTAALKSKISVSLTSGNAVLGPETPSSVNVQYTYSEITSQSKNVSNDLQISTATIDVSGELAPKYTISAEYTYLTPVDPQLSITWNCTECLPTIETALVARGTLPQEITASALTSLTYVTHAGPLQAFSLKSVEGVNMESITQAEYILVVRAPGSTKSYTYFDISSKPQYCSVDFSVATRNDHYRAFCQLTGGFLNKLQSDGHISNFIETRVDGSDEGTLYCVPLFDSGAGQVHVSIGTYNHSSTLTSWLEEWYPWNIVILGPFSDNTQGLYDTLNNASFTNLNLDADQLTLEYQNFLGFEYPIFTGTKPYTYDYSSHSTCAP